MLGEQVVDAHPLSGPMGRILPMLIGQHPRPEQADKEEPVLPPMGARILAVADAFDLLTVGTEHQAPLSPKEAKARILADQESGFDPDVVKTFAAAVDRMDLDCPACSFRTHSLLRLYLLFPTLVLEFF